MSVATARLLRPAASAERRVGFGVAALGVLVAAGMQAFGRERPLTTDDTWQYLEWSPIRSPGYPIFLDGFELLGADLASIWIPHAILLVGATAFLAAALARLTARPLAAALLGVAILGMPPLWVWVAQVRPEILFVTAVEVFFGAAALLLAGGGRWLALAASSALGVAILTRPVGRGLLPALALLAWVCGRRAGWRSAASLLVPALAMLLACNLANGLLRGYYAAQAFSGLSLLAKSVALMPAQGAGEPLEAELAAQSAPLREALVGADLHTTYWLTRQAYDVALWDFYIPRSVADGVDMVTADARAWRIGRVNLESDPLGYARIWAAHAIAMWTRPWISSQAHAAPVQARVARPQLQAWLGKAKLSDLDLVPAPVWWTKQCALALVALVCALAFPLAVHDRWRSAPLALAAIAGVAAHGYQALVGSIGYADNRYANAGLPVILIALVLAACALADRGGLARRAD